MRKFKGELCQPAGWNGVGMHEIEGDSLQKSFRERLVRLDGSSADKLIVENRKTLLENPRVVAFSALLIKAMAGSPRLCTSLP